MNINLIYDPSVSNAPAGFKPALDYVVNYFDTTFVDPVTINVDVGWGEVNGQSLGSGSLGESLQNAAPAYTYTQIRNALLAGVTSAADATAITSLPLADPTGGGNFDIGTAGAKALGLLPGNGTAIDGWVGFSSIPGTFTFDPNNQAVPGVYDFIGTAFHEISEVMGRFAGLNSFINYPHSYTALDLFRYSAPGVRQLAGGHSAYFSIDGGSTNLDNFNTNSHGDFGDWAASAGNDAFLAFLPVGVASALTPTDITAMDVIGWTTSVSASPEYTSGQINGIYQAVLQRPASIAEQNAWVTQEIIAGLTEAQVRAAIENSPEAVRYVDPIVRLYQAAFDRVPDQGGLNVNVNALHAAGSDLALAKAFVGSAEFAAIYGGTSVNSAFVSTLYQNVLGRVGSAAEIQAWLNTGQDAAHLLVGFSDSAEFISRSQPAVVAFLDAAAQGIENYTGPLFSNISHSVVASESVVLVGITSAQTEHSM